MNAKIDIKTPAGKSLEGFPIDLGVTSELVDISACILLYGAYRAVQHNDRRLHSGDTITIEIL